jgi:hypothetical protein
LQSKSLVYFNDIQEEGCMILQYKLAILYSD